MPNIKAPDTIKMANRTIKRLNRTVREGVRDIKGAGDSSGITRDSAAAPDNAPADVLEYTGMRAGMFAGDVLLHTGGKLGGKAIRSVQEPFRVKGRLQLAGKQAASAKDAAKAAGKTIKESRPHHKDSCPRGQAGNPDSGQDGTSDYKDSAGHEGTGQVYADSA